RAQQMQLEIMRQAFADPDAAHAVAALVERWREDTDAELAGQDRYHPAGDSALRGQPDLVHPFARVVVHPTRTHHAEHMRDMLATQGPLTGERVHATVSERGRHHREVLARSEHGALPEIEIERLVDVSFEHSEGPHQVPDRAVS